MNKGYSSEQKPGALKHQTLQPLSQDRHAASVAPLSIMYPIDAVSYVPEATSTDGRIDLAGHLVEVGDVLWFDGGALLGQEVSVIAVDTNSITLGNKQAAAITAAETFRITRNKNVAGDASGNLSITPGPIQFVLDSANTIVTEDTVTPSNNTPLPVKLTSVTGDINITANDLNVQLSHLGANADSTRIGNGTNLMDVNASLEALVHDEQVRLLAASIDTKMDLQSTVAQQLLGNADLSAINTKLTAGQLASAGSQSVVLSTEQEAKIDLLATEVTSAAILAKIIAAPATEAKQDTMITSLASILAKIIAAPATEAKQDTMITSLATIASVKDTVDVISPIDVSSSNIPASASLPLEIIASTSADMTKIQTIEDVGEYIGLYTGAAASEVLVAILPIAGGEVDISAPAGTRLSIRHMKNTAISTATFFAANLIG